jgi:HK97 family phage prohead protease
MQKVITVPFAKVDDAERMVYGYASTADRDSDGEVITLDALKNALPGYMKFASVREMHDARPIGKTKQAEVDERGLYIGAKIVDNDAWKLVKEEVYSAFSVGGKILERDEVDPSVIKSMSLMEISLVDVPANPQCVIDLVKVADIGLADENPEAPVEEVVEPVAEVEDVEKRKSDEDKDPDDDGDDDSEGSDDNDDKDEDDEDDEDDDDEDRRHKAAEVGREEDLLFKRISERFGIEKANEVFGIQPEVVAETDELEKAIDEAVDAISEELELEMAKAKALGEVAEDLTKIEDGEFLATALIDEIFAEFDVDQITALQATAKKAEVRDLLARIVSTKDIVAKAGSRHSRADMDSLQAIHDHACKMGAACAEKEAAVKPGDLAKSHERVRKLTSDLNAANETINKLNKQVADKEAYIEKLKKSPAKPLPITAQAELPEGLIAIGKGGEPAIEDDSNLNNEEKVMKAWRKAREDAFAKRF